jgi:transcriptional regulator with XRE-family HTH domain
MVDAENFYKKLGQRIREARNHNGFTQQELAAKVDLTRTSVTNIELGRQKLLVHALVEIADALQVAPAQLLPPASEPAPQSASEPDRNKILENRPADEQKMVRAALAAIEE